jgi:electron transport complex protein RnfE
MSDKKKSFGSIFFNGVVTENPTFRLVLGMCPTLAISTAVSQGIGMGLATTFVLVFSNLVISLLRHTIPEKVRIPSFVVVIATFVTIVDLLMKAFLPSLSQSLGVYIPLIVVNCIIFARAEAFAFKNPPLASLADGLGMGLGFTLAITLLSAVREVIGSGTFLGVQVMPAAYHPMAIVVRPPGGFVMLGLLLLTVNAIVKAVDKRKLAKSKEGIA